MARAENAEIIERFEEFYRDYYRDEIGELAGKYPTEARSLYVDWNDVYRFDPDLADDFLAQPDQMREYAEEALRLFDLPVDVKLGQAHVRLYDLPEPTEIREIRSDHAGRLVAVRGIVRKATDVLPKIQQAAFECQRCGTLTRIPQTAGGFQEPHECQGCERQGPFELNFDQSEFEDYQKLRIQESPEGLRGGETPQSIDVNVDDDITGQVTAGDHVTVTGVLHLDQQGSRQQKSSVFDFYMDGMTVEIEDEQFEEMDISDADKREIVELSSRPDIYELMVGSLAPSLYGLEKQKLAIILQLFSGVAKNLPDGSRIRGDLHMLLIGDPGTGKCSRYDTKVTLRDGSEIQIGDLVEKNLTNPHPIDDGYYQEVDVEVPSLDNDGQLTHQRATKVWKREAPDRMCRIRTASGRELEVTPSHPLFVNTGKAIAPKQAEQLSDGEFVATPQKIPTDGDDTLDIDCRSGTTWTVNSFEPPGELTPALARLLGYIIGEGHVAESEGTISITNSDEAVIEDVADCIEELGLQYRIRQHHTRANAEIVTCSSVEFVDFLEKLEPAILQRSGDQRLPAAILRATPRVKSAFLKAYIEGESSVSKNEREITVASMSDEVLYQVQSLLLSLGVDTQIQERKNGSFRLRLSGENFINYVEEIGFVTDRKRTAASEFDETQANTNLDIIPNIGDELRRIRQRLALSQFDCGIPRTTYQHYERGDRNPSRESLQVVLEAFEDRVEWLRTKRTAIDSGAWEEIEAIRDELNLSQSSLAAEMTVTQTAISYYERNGIAPDGGQTTAAKQVVLDRIDHALSVEDAIRRLRTLTDGDVSWDRIVSIETVDPDYEWVYDLEVEGTHSYVSNNIISHNSQLLQYVRNLAPRAVYTSGKGSSTAGLCVTGDTVLHTDQGFRPIREIVTQDLPDPVTRESCEERAVDVQTFDRDAGEMTAASSSQVWRMPEKPCHRIETSHGKELEASANTPILTCGDSGIEWTDISEIEAGDHVAVPRYGGIDRSVVEVRDFLELSTEKVQLSESSVSFLRASLQEAYGTLREAASALDLSEDFIYLHLKNRHVPLEKLDRMLEAIGASRDDIDFDRLMLRHGDSITVPETFDEDLMYLLGLVFGDGDISMDRRGGNRGMVRISNGDERLLERAVDIIDDTFDKRPDIEHQDDRVPCIRLNSATVARLFANVGMRTPKADLALAPELTVAEHADAFLRGLMDADGSVSVRDGGGSSVLTSTISDELARQVQLILETYGVRARTRERDRRGSYELESGQTIETKHVQHFVEMYGADIDRFAEAIGFECQPKRQALEQITGNGRRQRETIPVGSALATVQGTTGKYYQNIHRGDNPGRARAAAMLDDIDLGPVESDVREPVDADLRWDEVVANVHTGRKEVFDLTVPGTHNFVGNGIITHNTAAAVRDDFGDSQQWTLEAGALVLADKGVAAIDELGKMRCVTGDTLVSLGDGTGKRIRELAMDAAGTGTIEELPNGRTIRDIDLTTWTMTDDGRVVRRPVTAIHEYDAPETLYRVSLASGSSIVSTPDHPFRMETPDGWTERPAADVKSGDAIATPTQLAATDGGVASETRAADDRCVEAGSVEEVTRLDGHEYDRVYDLTVEGTHNFVANGVVVHNSEDRSAMHEALEQQSYHPSSEVLLADGRQVEIGEFVDRRMEADPDAVVDGVDCEILPVDDVRVHSTDLDDRTTTKRPVDRVSRHEAPDEFVRVTFSNGRSVTVTPEHPIFVDSAGEIDTVPAQELKEGAFVPGPRKLPNVSTPVDLTDEAHEGTEKDVSLPDELTPALGELLGFLVAEGHSFAGSSHEIGFSNQDERLLERVDDLYEQVFGMESYDSANAAATVTTSLISTKLYRWFESNFPEFMHTPGDKRIPARVLGASEEVIRRFLVGAFAGDGGVERQAMSFSTASPGLAQDYADALSKIGVASRIHHDSAEDSWTVYVMGDSNERFVDQVVAPTDERHAAAPSRETGHEALEEVERGAVDLADRCDLRFYRVREVETVPNEGKHATEWGYDLTVEPTNTFVSKGVVLHNSISISKAGINATLKSRCSLLGAANPKYGRFDQYEPIGEQIDLEPALVSRFDLIFTVTDEPDEEADRELAEHIIRTNYAGELTTHRRESAASNVTADEVEAVAETVEPAIPTDLLRKYVAYAKRNCFPTMTEEAKAAIRDFYVDLRAEGAEEDAPVPVTARKLEALVRLAEASARVRLSDTVDEADAERVIDIVRSCLRDIGVDPETGEFDADVVETGTSKTQRDRIRTIKAIIEDLEDDYEEGAPVEEVLERAETLDMERGKAEHEIEKLKRQGEVYEPRTDHLRTT